MNLGPILIVDDEPQNLALMRQILEPEHRLVFAREGSSAIQAAIKHKPSLVLLDLFMPGMDGYEVCRALKADPRTAATLVIFVTAISDLGNEAAGIEAGAVDYIVKPFSAEIVKTRVRAHLSTARLQQLMASGAEQQPPPAPLEP